MVGESDWSAAVERVRIDGNWAYRPAELVDEVYGQSTFRYVRYDQRTARP